MVKGLSRGKFGVVFTRVNFTQVTCGYTYSYLPRLISVSTQLFSLETLEGLSERAGFSVLKTLDIQVKKKRNLDSSRASANLTVLVPSLAFRMPSLN